MADCVLALDADGIEEMLWRARAHHDGNCAGQAALARLAVRDEIDI
jgi:hypothetical protein